MAPESIKCAFCGSVQVIRCTKCGRYYTAHKLVCPRQDTHFCGNTGDLDVCGICGEPDHKTSGHETDVKGAR